MPDSSDDIRAAHLRRADFLGVFALIESAAGVLLVANQRRIGGIRREVWDLPGGQVEPGELLQEALARELREEVGIAPIVPGEFLFFQEGEKRDPERSYVWRSFFYRVRQFEGVLGQGAEQLPWRFVPRAELPALLTAPYHDSFVAWLRDGGLQFHSVWQDPS